jgi:hypothetical protein
MDPCATAGGPESGLRARFGFDRLEQGTMLAAMAIPLPIGDLGGIECLGPAWKGQCLELSLAMPVKSTCNAWLRGHALARQVAQRVALRVAQSRLGCTVHPRHGRDRAANPLLFEQGFAAIDRFQCPAAVDGHGDLGIGRRVVVGRDPHQVAKFAKLAQFHPCCIAGPQDIGRQQLPGRQPAPKPKLAAAPIAYRCSAKQNSLLAQALVPVSPIPAARRLARATCGFHALILAAPGRQGKPGLGVKKASPDSKCR